MGYVAALVVVCLLAALCAHLIEERGLSLVVSAICAVIVMMVFAMNGWLQ